MKRKCVVLSILISAIFEGCRTTAPSSEEISKEFDQNSVTWEDVSNFNEEKFKRLVTDQRIAEELEKVVNKIRDILKPKESEFMKKNKEFLGLTEEKDFENFEDLIYDQVEDVIDSNLPTQLDNNRKQEITDYIRVVREIRRLTTLKFVDHFEKELIKAIPSYTSNSDLKMTVKVLREYADFGQYSIRLQSQVVSKSSNDDVRKLRRLSFIYQWWTVIKVVGEDKAKVFFNLNR